MLGDAFVLTIPAGNPIGDPGGCETLALVHSGLTRVVFRAWRPRHADGRHWLRRRGGRDR
jgi:hypothetical protein